LGAGYEGLKLADTMHGPTFDLIGVKI